jgi:uncharacterized protein YecT (DUF1311 family)
MTADPSAPDTEHLTAEADASVEKASVPDPAADPVATAAPHAEAEIEPVRGPETAAQVDPAPAAPVAPEPEPSPEPAPEPVAEARAPAPRRPVQTAPAPEPTLEPVSAAAALGPPESVEPPQAAYDDDLRLGQPGAPPGVTFRRNRLAAAAVVGVTLLAAAYALKSTLDRARDAPFTGGTPARVEISKAPTRPETPVVEATPYEEGPVTGVDDATGASSARPAAPPGAHVTESPGAMHQVAPPSAAPAAPTAPVPQRELRPVVPPALAARPAPESEPETARADCRGVGGRLARMFCEYPDLAAADRRLQRLYQRALTEADDPDEVRDRQSIWMAARDAAARDGPDAVAEVYQNRIDELRREGR